MSRITLIVPRSWNFLIVLLLFSLLVLSVAIPTLVNVGNVFLLHAEMGGANAVSLTTHALQHASSLYNLALFLNNDSTQARWGLGRVAIARGDFSSAVHTLDPLVENDVETLHENPYIYRDILIAFDRTGQAEQVIELYEHVGPTHIPVVADIVAFNYLVLSEEFLKSKDLHSARELLYKTLTIRPDDLYARYHLMLIEANSGNMGLSQEHLERIKYFSLEAINPSYTPMLDYIADLYPRFVDEDLWSKEVAQTVVSYLNLTTYSKQPDPEWLHRINEYSRENGIALIPIIRPNRSNPDPIGVVSDVFSIDTNYLNLGRNLVSDGSFEGVIGINWCKNEWSGGQLYHDANFLIETDTTIAYAGQASLRMIDFWVDERSGGPARAGVQLCRDISIKPNSTYLISFAYRTWTVDSNISEIWAGSSAKVLFNRYFPDTRGQWWKAFILFNVPEDNETALTLMLRIRGVGIVWFDQVNLYEVSGLSKWPYTSGETVTSILDENGFIFKEKR